MKHIHLETCNSTQKYLIEMIKENVKTDSDILVSCDTQTEGTGQKQNTWDCYDNTLCLSSTIIENKVITLTPLEIGVIICEYFNLNFKTKLMLKWPNDILNHNNEKVGGVIINKSGNSPLIIGIGLNLFPSASEKIVDYSYKAGFIFKDDTIKMAKKEIANKLYSYILANRLSSNDTVERWNSLCIHRNINVFIQDTNKDFSGKFIGIGRNGQALISDEGQTTEFYSGSLRI